MGTDNSQTRSPEILLMENALQRIADISSAFKVPGRKESYRDFELRQIARDCLTEVAQLREETAQREN